VRLWLGVSVVLALFVGFALVSRGRRAVPDAAPRAAPCVAEMREDPRREARIRALVATLPGGIERLRVVTAARFCFGDRFDVPATTRDGRLELDARASDAETAARVSHLLAHHVAPFPPVTGFDPAQPCAPQVSAALDAEAAALVQELADRQRLSVSAPRLEFAFAAEVERAADDAARVRIVRAFIDVHPDGGGGIDALATGYASTCARARASR
jgi:hypothetical protein